jgi:hypothetical protein
MLSRASRNPGHRILLSWISNDNLTFPFGSLKKVFSTLFLCSSGEGTVEVRRSSVGAKSPRDTPPPAGDWEDG